MVFLYRITNFIWLPASLLISALPSLANTGQASPHSYEKDVLPILEAHCVKCHGPDKQKGKLRFDTLSTDFLKDRAAAETWHDASDQVKLGEMPPEEEDPLSSEDRKILTEWIDHNLSEAFKKMQGTENSLVMRRLNRAEYQHTMTDLLGFEMDYSDELPNDSLSPDGFLNNGASSGDFGRANRELPQVGPKSPRLRSSGGREAGNLDQPGALEQGEHKGPWKQPLPGLLLPETRAGQLLARLLPGATPGRSTDRAGESIDGP